MRNLSQFALFLETASFSQGQVINMSEIARETAIDRKLIANYFDILGLDRRSDHYHIMQSSVI